MFGDCNKVVQMRTTHQRNPVLQTVFVRHQMQENERLQQTSLQQKGECFFLPDRILKRWLVLNSVAMGIVPHAKNLAPALCSAEITSVHRCVIAGLVTLASKPKRWPVVAVLVKSRCLAAGNWGWNHPNVRNFARKFVSFFGDTLYTQLLYRIPPDCHHVKRDNHRCHFGDCPPCRQVCSKTHSACGHNCPAICHSAVLVKVEGQKASMPWEQSAPLIERRDQPCPECKVPVRVTCLGGHETSDWPCFMAKPSSCGRPCGRLLPCSNHTCSLPCHKIVSFFS